jgi:hypothetical protein
LCCHSLVVPEDLIWVGLLVNRPGGLGDKEA